MKEFIKNNNITFEVGKRNNSVTICIGYAQYIEISKDELKKSLSKQIKADSFIEEEIERLWDYCDRNVYRNYWVGPEAHKLYKY